MSHEASILLNFHCNKRVLGAFCAVCPGRSLGREPRTLDFIQISLQNTRFVSFRRRPSRDPLGKELRSLDIAQISLQKPRFGSFRRRPSRALSGEGATEQRFCSNFITKNAFWELSAPSVQGSLWAGSHEA